MGDATTVWYSGASGGDWTLVGGQLAGGNDLETAVLISLFTDRVADPDDDIPDTSADPRGWWADQGEGRPIGSRLWLLGRSKETPETLKKARDYIEEALDWIVEDGLVSAVDVTVEWSQPGRLGALLVLHAPNGARTPMQLTWPWNGVM